MYELAEGLLEAEGYAVDVTSRGEDAVEAARRERFDLVILDIGLPDMSGFEVLRTIRRVSDVPVLMLTAHGGEMEQVRGLDLGEGPQHEHGAAGAASRSTPGRREVRRTAPPGT